MVPIPPVVAAMGTPKRNAFVKGDCFPRDFSSGIIEAITIAVVAVFDISIEATIVVNINPISRFLGLEPDILNVNRNKASSRLVLVIAAAIKKPPSISHIILLEKVVTYFSIFSGAELRWGFPNIKTR